MHITFGISLYFRRVFKQRNWVVYKMGFNVNLELGFWREPELIFAARTEPNLETVTSCRGFSEDYGKLIPYV